ncbi:acyl-CoA N-acyltransferase [Mytilinidion resinicola]|uniref:Acyl-CoA N-acyltransferase n=1 Tax=Mytilinidion resinicola TaxID=574789 RepID=A0A6A6XZY3_9PEZI|nr:acyl-CoA N-acyltransferase [Mytilinidion resinicola]KAF2802126.1 acyl-CoA N-acyltransferase [Mytilinidion resinicola]
MSTEQKEESARTKRLLIRPLRLDDANDVFLMRSNPEVMEFTSALPSTDIQKSRDWVSDCITRSNCHNFSMELLPSASTTTSSPEENAMPAPRVIGVIGAMRTPEVGYMINAEYWGKGYASEALQGYMPIFFDHYSGEERHDFADALVDTTHAPSRRVLEKAGFKLLEIRERDFKSPTQGIRDTCVYRMARPA